MVLPPFIAVLMLSAAALSEECVPAEADSPADRADVICDPAWKQAQPAAERPSEDPDENTWEHPPLFAAPGQRRGSTRPDQPPGTYG